MLRATSLIRKPAVKADKIIDTVSLDHDERQKRRVSLTGDGGLAFLVDLDKATVIADGDALKLEDGRLVQVRAAPEKLLEIRAENPLRLMRVAWHIGNRHTPAEITADAIYISHDHVLAEMVRGQGCIVSEVTKSFEPQRGAYDHAGHDHGSHGHDAHDAHNALDDNSHDHHDHKAHDHAAHDHKAHEHKAHEHKLDDHHDHGPDCGCGHDHSHDNGHVHEHLEKAHDHGQDHKQVHKQDHKHDHAHDHKHGH